MVLKKGDIVMFYDGDASGIFPVLVTNVLDDSHYYQYEGAGVEQMYPAIDQNLPGVYPMYSTTPEEDDFNPCKMLWIFNENETHLITSGRGAEKTHLL
jgi:hypothetical protein